MHFDYPPRLIRRETEFQPRSSEVGEGEISFGPSPFDPWSELEVIRMLGAVYATGTSSSGTSDCRGLTGHAAPSLHGRRAAIQAATAEPAMASAAAVKAIW
jgi:hypothetical protein